MINRNGVSKKRGRRVSAGGGASGLFTWRPARQNSPPSRGTNRPNGGLFHATTATNPICAGAGSGERRDETKKSALSIHPRPLSTTARSAPPPTTEPAAAAFVRPPVGRRVLRHDRNTHKFTRSSTDRRPSCVVCRSFGERRARDNRFVAIKSAFAPWTKCAEFAGSSSQATETKKLTPVWILRMPKWLVANMAGSSST